MALVQKLEGSETYSFPVDGREKFIPLMTKAGYVEMVAFKFSESAKGYFCKSCPAMIEKANSHTGYFCQKFGFEDRPYGCCSGWYAFPNVQKIQDNLN